MVSAFQLTGSFDVSALNLPDLVFREIVNKTADAIVVIDQSHGLVFVNHAAEKMFGYEAIELIGQQLEILLPQRLRHLHARHIDNFADSSSETAYMGNRKNHILGRHAHGYDIKIGATIVRINSGDEVLFAAILRDIGWRVDLIDEITDASRKDPLTGVANRRHFDEIAKKEWERALRYKTCLSCLFLDIDNFKDVNDQFGHDAGDIVLKEFADILLQSARSIDLLCRWGGEEFIAILPDTDRKGAFSMAERFRRIVENHRFSLPDGMIINITVSIGIDDDIKTAGSLRSLIRNADAALYAAKQTGRNRVIVHNNYEWGKSDN